MSIIVDASMLEMMKGLEDAAAIKILHAGIVGSHNSGLVNPTSDIDILFIYADKLERYFDISEPKQVINIKHGGFDITAFSLKKAIDMVVKSNPAIIHLLCAKNKIISVPSFFRQMEQFAKEYYSPQRLFGAFSAISTRYRAELIAGEDKDLKVFLGFVRTSLSLHHCSCYGLIKNDFSELVRLSCLSEESKRTVALLTEEYKGGKTHTSASSVYDVIGEIDTLTKTTQFNYSAAPLIGTDKIRDFHMKTILELSRGE